MAHFTPNAPAKTGRPSKCTVERLGAICERLRKGDTRKTAVCHADVSYKSFCTYLKDAEFRAAVEQAEQVGMPRRAARRLAAMKPKPVRRRVGADVGRKDKYGLTPGEYDLLYHAQCGLCAICGRPETVKDKNGIVRALSVDHCHAGGHVRGLLCQCCNTALGLFRDDVERLRRAIAYLESPRTPCPPDAQVSSPRIKPEPSATGCERVTRAKQASNP